MIHGRQVEVTISALQSMRMSRRVWQEVTDVRGGCFPFVLFLETIYHCKIVTSGWRPRIKNVCALLIQLHVTPRTPSEHAPLSAGAAFASSPQALIGLRGAESVGSRGVMVGISSTSSSSPSGIAPALGAGLLEGTTSAWPGDAGVWVPPLAGDRVTVTPMRGGAGPLVTVTVTPIALCVVGSPDLAAVLSLVAASDSSLLDMVVVAHALCSVTCPSADTIWVFCGAPHCFLAGLAPGLSTTSAALVATWDETRRDASGQYNHWQLSAQDSLLTRIENSVQVIAQLARESEWVEWVSWLIDWLIDWLSEWVSEFSGWVSERASEWVSEWVSEWMSGWVSERVGGWVSEWVPGWVSEWVSEWVGEWMDGLTSKRVTELAS